MFGDEGATVKSWYMRFRIAKIWPIIWFVVKPPWKSLEVWGFEVLFVDRSGTYRSIAVIWYPVRYWGIVLNPFVDSCLNLLRNDFRFSSFPVSSFWKNREKGGEFPAKRVNTRVNVSSVRDEKTLPKSYWIRKRTDLETGAISAGNFRCFPDYFIWNRPETMKARARFIVTSSRNPHTNPDIFLNTPLETKW